MSAIEVLLSPVVIQASPHLRIPTEVAASAADGDAAGTLLVLLSAALVLLMTPGLAFFYGGMVRSTGVVSMMMMSFGAIAVVGVLWVLIGYGTVFGDPLVAHWLGNPVSEFGLAGLVDGEIDAREVAFAAYQATFAIITVALISGAIADRAKFGAWVVFAGVWVTAVYLPVAYWVFNLADGWAAGLGVIDFAGGTAVHINAGAAGLALALVLGRRVHFRRGAHQPHNVPLMMLGVALLWFGWFGFTTGAQGAVDGTAALVWLNTLVTPSASVLGWLAVEKLLRGKPTSVGAASGVVAGLVAVTPAVHVLTPAWSLVLGLIAGVACCLAVDLKYRWGFDDSLDVVGIHLVGGLIGALFIGIAGTGVGLLATGSWGQLGLQALGCAAVLAYSFVASWLIGTAIHRTVGFRVTTRDEVAGVDGVLHGESGYAPERLRL